MHRREEASFVGVGPDAWQNLRRNHGGPIEQLVTIDH
jgi:hypothetical protein